MFIAPVSQMRVRAFTLIEVTLAVAILAMMSLAIFRFVQVNIISVRISSQTAAADAQYDGLRDLLSTQWQTLTPGKSALTGEAHKLGGQASRAEIRWKCGPGPGLLTRYASGDFLVELRLQPSSEKNSDKFDLGLLRRPQDDSDLVHEHDTWVPLIKNISSLQIRYFDPRLGKDNAWVDRWSDTVTLPKLVEVTVDRPDAPVPWQAKIPLSRTPY